MNDRALEYLNRVIAEHPGTPWAYLAKVELRDPLGWEWVEGHIAIDQTADSSQPPTPQFAAEEEQRRQQQQMRQQKRVRSLPNL